MTDLPYLVCLIRRINRSPDKRISDKAFAEFYESLKEKNSKKIALFLAGKIPETKMLALQASALKILA